MFVRAYLRASTDEQDATRARDQLHAFAKERGLTIAATEMFIPPHPGGIGSKLFELTGTRAVLEHLNLDVFWRNARTHTLHDPVRWKYHFVGDFWPNDRPPPRTGTL